VADSPLISEIMDCSLATVMARKGVSAQAIGDRLGLVAPVTPHWTGDGRLTLIGTGPGTWLARADGEDPDWPEALARKLAGLASVSDVSGSYRLFRVAGPQARQLLRRGAFVDVHPAAFAPGSVAVTLIAHIGVIIRQIDDAPVYEFAVFRSLGDSFRHWLDTAAATL
jgi:sarcosine oxidase subunit gamma